MILLRLFLEYFKIGLFSVGGGLATIPFLYELSSNTGWFTVEQLTNMIAISESTPGPIGVNMASYVGFSLHGIIGCVIATVGLVTPCVICIIIIAKLLEKFRESSLVKNMFYGLRPASIGLVCAAGIEVVKVSLLHLGKWQVSGAILDIFSYKSIILAAVLYFAIKKFKGHPVWYLLGSAIVGIVFKFAV
ncbi:MAG: chromate transporter [Oscillospiraceae bacterium]